jgi:hypothetical protein
VYLLWGKGRWAGLGWGQNLAVPQVGQEMRQGAAPLLEGAWLVRELLQEQIDPVGEVIEGKVSLTLDKTSKAQKPVSVLQEGGGLKMQSQPVTEKGIHLLAEPAIVKLLVKLGMATE